MAFSRQNVRLPASVVVIGLAVFQIYSTGGFPILSSLMQRGIHLALIMVLMFLGLPTRKRGYESSEPLSLFLLDLLLVVAAVAMGTSVCLNNDVILDRIRYVDPLTTLDYVMGSMAAVLVLEATRRTAGPPLIIVSAVFLLYAFLGQGLPSGLRPNGILVSDLVEQLFLTTDGIYGVPLAAASGMIFAFVIFGAFLEQANMSALFGTISGSAPAKVYGTGTFTIPIMKRAGYSPAFAGAVEAVASTGGQMMPPIMGAAAFIMADLVGTGYLQIAKAALLPSFLYYLALLAMIHFEEVNRGIGRLPEDQVPAAHHVLTRLYYLPPLAALIGAMSLGRGVISCAFIGILAVLLLSVFRAETRFTPRRLAGALEQAARNALMISSCCACAGLVVAVIPLTGVGYKFISFVTLVAGNNLFLLMICLMLTSMVLGMGVPTRPAYIIVATLGAPALVKAGVPAIAAHLFVFSYAILSAITPPVCVASFSGAAIAGATAMKTGWMSVKLGIVAFVIPFMFVYLAALLLQGETGHLVMACVTSIIGVLCLAGGLQGWLLSRCALWERPLLAAGGLALIDAGSSTDLEGLGLLGGIALL